MRKITIFATVEMLLFLLLSNGEAQTNLHFASERGDFNEVVRLLDNGADVNIHDSNSLAPLDYALDSGNLKLVSLLLERGADVNNRDKHFGSTALHYAATIGNLELISLLLERGADINIYDKNGVTPLGMAKIMKQEEAIELLVKHGAR